MVEWCGGRFTQLVTCTENSFPIKVNPPMKDLWIRGFCRVGALLMHSAHTPNEETLELFLIQSKQGGDKQLPVHLEHMLAEF